MRLLPLHAAPQHVPALARRHQPQWQAAHPGMTLAAWEAEFARHADARQPLPTTLLALDDDGSLLGSASLVADDMDGAAPWSPWLANVLVTEAARGRGIGQALIDGVIAEARALGFAKVFLFTEDQQDFYARRGWTLLEERDHHGHRVCVMCRAT
ncbi:MAG: GNAT family N-acetyltransferase [Moraxellaceae bacterium]